MSDKELNEKFGLLINFLAIQLVMTLVVIVLMFSFRMESQKETVVIHEQLNQSNDIKKGISAEVKIISEEFQIFKGSVPYDPVRKKRIEKELKGNFNKFDGEEI